MTRASRRHQGHDLSWSSADANFAAALTQTRTLAQPSPLPNFRHSFIPALTELGE